MVIIDYSDGIHGGKKVICLLIGLTFIVGFFMGSEGRPKIV